MLANHVLELPIVNGEEDNICLPLVISAVSRYWNEDVPLNEAREMAKKYPNVKGSIMMEGIELAERRGFKSYIYRGSLQDIQKRIDQGIPPIVILPGIREIVQHATIISGYDDSTNRVLTYFPEPDKIGAIPYKQFSELWKQDDNITMLLVPADMGKIVERDRLLFANSNRLCLEAERLHLQGRQEEAVSTLVRARDVEPENPRVWSQLGTMYNEKSNEEAVRCYEQTIRLNPNFYLAYRGLGNYYLKKKDYAGAEKYYSQAIAINSYRFGPIYKNRGIARMELGKKREAAQDFVLYLEQCPDARDRNSVQAVVSMLSQT